MDNFFKPAKLIKKDEYLKEEKYLHKVKLTCIYKKLKVVKMFYFHWNKMVYVNTNIFITNYHIIKFEDIQPKVMKFNFQKSV